MARDEAEKIAKRTFKPASVERAWIISRRSTLSDLVSRRVIFRESEIAPMYGRRSLQ